MNRTTLLALLIAGSALVCGCAQKEQAATAQPQNAYQPATDPRETATPQDTLEELSHQSISVLDLGVYRLRKEVIPDIDKRLRSTGLLPPIPGSGIGSLEFGNVSLWVGNSPSYPYEKIVQINVYMPATHTASSEKTIRELQESEKKIVSAIRAEFGSSCPSNDDPSIGTHGLCKSASGFYSYWFQPPSALNEPVIGAQYRAAYNLYSLFYVDVWGMLDAGTPHYLDVHCTGPLIRDEVKCTAQGNPTAGQP